VKCGYLGMKYLMGMTVRLMFRKRVAPNMTIYLGSMKRKRAMDKNTSIIAIEQLNWFHSLFQEFEDQKVILPMGDYSMVYDMLEDLRDTLEIGLL
jgi:hypothetical protein